jgi:hypothetical protein
MKSGIELIAEERQEQITKHGWSLERDAEYYKNGELIQAAKFSEIATGRGIGFDGDSPERRWPKGWDQYFRRKILSKTKVGALSVAGAFYMAENDRIGEKKYQADIERIAAEIDRLQTPQP